VTSYQFSKTEELTLDQLSFNVAIFEVSEPDARGYMSFGPLGTFNNGLVSRLADKVIVQVNKKHPLSMVWMHISM